MVASFVPCGRTLQVSHEERWSVSACPGPGPAERRAGRGNALACFWLCPPRYTQSPARTTFSGTLLFFISLFFTHLECPVHYCQLRALGCMSLEIFPSFFKKMLSECCGLTMLGEFQGYSRGNQLHICMYSFFSRIGYYRILKRCLCARQQVLVS